MEEEIITSWKLIFELSRKLHDFGIAAEHNPADNVTVAQSRVIGVVFSRAPRSVMLKEIAAELNLTPGAVSQTIDALVRDGMLERCTAEHDRRAVAIRPTGRMEDFRRQRGGFLSRNMEKFLADISPEDQKTFLRVLTAVRDKLDMERNLSDNCNQFNVKKEEES